jgi:SAM-dependent methyltransferase
MPQTLTATARGRWDELLGSLVSLIPDGMAAIIDHPADGDALTDAAADRIIGALNAAGLPCSRRPGSGDGRPEVVIWVRTIAPRRRPADGGTDADIVIDTCDPGWPVIRRVAPPLAGRGTWYLAETRAFFAARAATWDTKFGDDVPVYAAAVAEAGLVRGGTVIDVGCGTGRAVPALREAVGPYGRVLAMDLTPEMLEQARPKCAPARAALARADARMLPLADGAADAVFAAGLVMHLPDPADGLRELARVTRPGGRLVLFHPSGRAALAARHGRTLRPDEPLAEEPLRRASASAGWELTAYDDAEHRFLALAVRQAPASSRQATASPKQASAGLRHAATSPERAATGPRPTTASR